MITLYIIISRLREADYLRIEADGRIIEIPNDDISFFCAMAVLYANRQKEQQLPKNPLTKREREVATLLMQGFSMKEVADKLCMSIKTVPVHCWKIHTKLGINKNTEIAAAMRKFE